MTVVVFLKNVRTDVEEPRGIQVSRYPGIQVETQSASKDFKHRILDM
jgi:hypothetical protein